ncbi:XRE family transcriptional regulator [Rhodococcus sp. Z13]|uniref:XRE family transcriptional regulator n=1 Tax=Rhodococcus sacchari TaxID=2962047 RepID=A0ACD4DFB4_9NOCA|nr:XRE family transcriptional regulator [Rhodococcus sp. Z13]UYP18755.1 XRE family transcriptional regulator [Rhodococcus sp. Z13]
MTGADPGDSVGRTSDGEPKLTLAIVEDLKSKGYTQSDIARMYGVTRQYVSWIKHTYGGHLTPRERIMREFPWKVPTAMTQQSPYRRLREHGEYVVTGGKGMDRVKLTRLRGFYAKLRDHVLEFDPFIPPQPGVANRGGFAYRPRLDSDGDLLIRVNEHTNLTERGREIWRFPDVEP